MPALTAALFALSATDTLSKFVTQRRAASGAEAQGNFEASMADAQAADALVRGQKEEYKIRTNTRQLVGEQTSAAAGQGIDITSGSSQDLINESHMMEQFDINSVRNNAALEAWGFKTSAALSRYAGKKQASDLRAQSWGTLATGAASIFGIYEKAYGGSGGNIVTPRVSSNGNFQGEDHP